MNPPTNNRPVPQPIYIYITLLGVTSLDLAASTDIRYLKGVGEKRAALYQKLRIKTVGDLLYHFPRDYLDLNAPYTISAAPIDRPCAIRARLVAKGREQRVRKGLSIFKLRAEDESGVLQITVFNSKYTVESLKLDQEYIFHGSAEGSLLQREMSSPSIYPAQSAQRILPIYPQTAGISSQMIRKSVEQALQHAYTLADPIPEQVRGEYGLPEINEALRQVHLPDTLEQAGAARTRFIFEELLVLSLALSSLHADRATHRVEPMRHLSLDAFYDALPFRPTGAQLRCIGEATGDLCAQTPMNRLVQGDVGSGKTLVVAACVYFAYLNGFQSAVMVPTGILAEQHYATLLAMLEPLGVRCALLTGATRPARKRELYLRLASGEIHLCIGTHALLSEGVQFQNLALVVTDEQHRFGVAQRARLSKKSEDCHMMVLSATPIPRTLSLIIYGDLKLSTIDELPPGRQPVETFVVGGALRQRALGFVKKALGEGRQAYIVCPLIEQGEIDTDLKPATDYALQLSRGELRGYRVGLLHGRMKAAEKEEAMRRFKAGDTQVLVSTTVVEVGVDVPNATIILIENAERFGLSQLHQLRGRVGRGSERSYCILISDARGAVTRERLGVMKRTNDGFEVAEHDLRLRGPGDFFGYRQHGLPALRVADLSDDLSVMQSAQRCAEALLCGDPTLSSPRHAGLSALTKRMLEAVGERPN